MAAKGFIKKNITKVCGFPLIAYTIEVCKQSNFIDRIVVSTEDEEIAKIALLYGAEVPFIRPKELAQDYSTDYDVVNHFFCVSGVNQVAYMRPTTPLRDPETVDDVIKEFYTIQEKITGLRTIQELSEPPYKMCKLDQNHCCAGFFDNFNGITDYMNLPRQVFPKAYHPNGYVDLIKKESLGNNEVFGNKIKGFITKYTTEIDSEHELELLKFELSKKKYKVLEMLRDRHV